MRERVLATLERIRPVVQADGGDVELVNISSDGVVQVRLQGVNQECPMSQMTLKNGIEHLITSEIPEVTAVVAV